MSSRGKWRRAVDGTGWPWKQEAESDDNCSRESTNAILTGDMTIFEKKKVRCTDNA
jgi:hypothetical protein